MAQGFPLARGKFRGFVCLFASLTVFGSLTQKTQNLNNLAGRQTCSVAEDDMNSLSFCLYLLNSEITGMLAPLHLLDFLFFSIFCT